MLDPYFKRRYPAKHLKKLLYWNLVEHSVLRDAAAVLFTCEDERLLAQQSFQRYSAQERVVSFGTTKPLKDVAALRGTFFGEFPQLKAQKLVLFLGRIHEKKGCDLAIEAFAQCANEDERLRLVMAGPGDEQLVRNLQAAAALYRVTDRIVWTGMLHGDLKWGALAAADAFILPSHQENFGIAVAEALAMGTPVLISNKVNIWREIMLDQAGFADEDSVEGTVRTLRRWMALAPEEVAQMRARAERSFLSRFRMEGAADRLVSLVREVQ
jgi:glycosyltransferase involved in cell wall biosynthesis